MKKIFSTILTMIIFAGCVSAQTISAETLKNDLQKLISDDYKSKTSAEVNIKISMLPFQNLNLNDGKISYVLINNTDECKLVSRDVKRVNILVDNKLERTLSVPIEINAYDEVMVAAENISREQPISLNKTRFKKMNITNKSEFVVTKAFMNK